MGFFKKLFGGGDEPAGEQHALLLRLRLSDDAFGSDHDREELFALQEELESAIADVGELDGDGWGEGYCEIFMYGANADALWEAVAPVLEKRPFRRGSTAVRRYGEADDAREEKTDLHWEG